MQKLNIQPDVVITLMVVYNMFIKRIASLQYSLVRRLFDKYFHQWKVIPLYLIQKYLCKTSKFHSNLDLRKSRLRKFTKYYREMLFKWGEFLSSSPDLPSAIISQFISFACFFSSFSDKGLNFVWQLFDRDGKFKTCGCLKDDFSLTNTEEFKLFQIIHALPKQ